MSYFEQFNANVTISPGPSQIGSVTVSNPVQLAAGTNLIGTVTVANPGSSGMTTLFPGPNQIGSVTISNIVNAIATITPRTDFLGLMTVTQGNQPALIAGTAQIGSVTVSNVVGAIATISPRTDYIGLVSVSGNVVNLASSAWIGLSTINSGRSMTTSLATVYSASGNSTVFVPPSGQRFFIHNLMINSQGNQNGNILSGTKPIWPFVGLATTGGFAMPFDNPGLPASAINEALVLTLNSAVTTSIGCTVHFE